jgi:hypothetical protein
LEDEFLTGIGKNLRMRVFLNPWKNLVMFFSKSYSRTHRLGELYQCFLYDKVVQKNGKPVKSIAELLISPGGDNNFSIITDNWKRVDKVPQLILNATSVNTGHNFQFTASWMGEPPGYIQPDIDVKPRLRRMYYGDAPGKEYQEFRLGYAVAASSCVPALFEPLPMYDLYKDPKGNDVKLQLIDGGLHDNQGIASLIEQECKNMIISDASGQMATTIVDTGNPLSVFFRADTILQERVREIQFMDLKERNKTLQINSLSTLHLKSGLHQRPWSWVNCNDPVRKIFDSDMGIDLPSTGILPEAQQLISEIRTDLDAFHETEAYAIMYCGYAQTNARLGGISAKASKDWKFLKAESYLKTTIGFDQVKSRLKAANKVPFKVFRISWIAQVIAAIAILALGYLLVHYIQQKWEAKVGGPVTVGYIALTVALFVIGLISEKLLILFNWKNVVIKKMILAGLVFSGFFICGIYLTVFNKLYRIAGKLGKEKS